MMFNIKSTRGHTGSLLVQTKFDQNLHVFSEFSADMVLQQYCIIFYIKHKMSDKHVSVLRPPE